MKKIKIKSRLGEIEIDQETIITFERGILGFPNLKKYALIDLDSSSPLKYLQALEDENIGFVVTNPIIFKSDYEIKIKRNDLEEIGINNPKHILSLVIVHVPENPEEMTANLKGPIIINSNLRKGKQLVLDQTDYELKYRLLPKMKKVANDK
jgi:flagellar assembly factor FliW